jgi:arabinogalactan oligomer/maltooligosaccharide transport system permease protein
LLYGVVTIVLLLLFTAVWVMNIKGSYENDLRLARGEHVRSFKEDVFVLFGEKFYAPLLIPPLLGLLVFTVLPLIFMVLIAFTNYDYAHMPPGKLFDWVGFSNFASMFSFTGGGTGFALIFLRVLAWTFIWAFFATFTNYFLGIVIALLIQKKGIKLKVLWRTLFVMAIAVPQFVTLLLMQKILDGDGILNKILGTNILWLADQRFFSLLPRIMIILVNVWIGVPYTILMSTGILMNIPADYYEAARIDGASPVRIFLSITMPYMLHVTTPYLITQFVGNINNFNVIWLLTGGGPVDNIYYGRGSQAQSTDLLVTWLYRLTVDENPKFNVASVIGIVIFVISAALSLITYNRTSSAKKEDAFQ